VVYDVKSLPQTNDQDPLVSVIIIFLNEERFLEEAIESVLAQTYTRWELLLVDDGSTDRSTEIARRYAQEHPHRIVYLEHPQHANRGMSASRNLGVRNARGTYIAYLDGDDAWLPNKLERQVALLRANPDAVMVYGPLLWWQSWTGLPEDQNKDFLYGLDDTDMHLEGDRLMSPPALLSLFIEHEPFIPAGVMVERRVLEEVGGAEEQFRANYEDAVVHAKVCLRYPVYLSSECWYKYRIHPDSCARVTLQQGAMDNDRRLFLEWLERYVAEQGVQDRVLARALRNALLPYRRPALYALQQLIRKAVAHSMHAARAIVRAALPQAVRVRLRNRMPGPRQSPQV
jgi:glycosyltransferase involved in cell wall biosynthesis